MNDTVEKIKRRTELENRVMEMGMDNNLVKNMAEIVRSQGDIQGRRWILWESKELKEKSKWS